MNTYIKLLEMISDKLCALFVGVGQKKMRADTKPLTKFLTLYKNVQRLHFNYSQEKLVTLDAARLKLLESISKKDPLDHTEIIGLLFDLEEVEMQLHV